MLPQMHREYRLYFDFSREIMLGNVGINLGEVMRECAQEVIHLNDYARFAVNVRNGATKLVSFNFHTFIYLYKAGRAVCRIVILITTVLF